MLTAEGCRRRRERFWQQLGRRFEGDHVRLTDPIHLMYLANFHVEPISLNAGSHAVLILRRDGHTRLLHDDRQQSYARLAHVDDAVCAPWYDSQSPGKGARQLALVGDVNHAHTGLRIHDRPGDPDACVIVGTLAQMRRQKDADEIALLQACMRATEAGHAWARANIAPGMSELNVYSGVVSACTKAARQPVIVYGDFAVSPGRSRRGGPPTTQILQPGDMFTDRSLKRKLLYEKRRDSPLH